MPTFFSNQNVNEKLKKEKDYLFHLTFLLLDKAELAVSRVAGRIKMGGHFVPEDTI